MKGKKREKKKTKNFLSLQTTFLIFGKEAFIKSPGRN